MGHRAFIARSGWSKTPISAEEWQEAVATLPEFELFRGSAGAVRAMLRGSRQRGLELQQGYLCGEHVDARLIAAMFVLADRLGARVYSEHRRVYRDVADWQRRTERHGRRRRTGSGASDLASAAAPRPSAAVASWAPFLLAGILTCLVAIWAFQ